MAGLVEREVFQRLSWDQTLADFEWCIRVLEGHARERAIEFAMRQLEDRLDFLAGITMYVQDQLDSGVYDDWIKECEDKIQVCRFNMGGGIEC